MSLYTKIIDLQKLEASLQKVVKNKPAAGVDGITYDMFVDNKKENLKQLNLELMEHRYHPLPVKLVSLYKGEKERRIALYSMRDKVVQQSIASELQKIYEPGFSKGTYAYRNGRSALQAIECIEENMCKYRDGWVLKMDIHSFFDSILPDKLKQELEYTIREADVLELIMENAQAESLQPDGELVKKTRGIWQGSGIAPVLSNIYLKRFDFELEEKALFFVRYSDDILVLAESQESALEILRFTKVHMQERGLVLNEKKTLLVPVSRGIDFLGYHFNHEGKRVPAKAEINLQEKLESMFLTNSNLSVKEKLKKGAEILEGWEQYYREERSIGSILEYAVVLYMVENKEETVVQKICSLRPLYKNIYRELTEYMTLVWKKIGKRELELLEYEQLYNLDELDRNCIIDYDAPFVKELVAGFEKMIIHEDHDVLMEIIQDYTEMHCLNKASRLMERYHKLENNEKQLIDKLHNKNAPDHIIVDSQTKRLFYELFVGREDMYSEEHMTQRRIVEQINEPLTEEILEEHLSGKRTIGTFVQRPNGTAKYLVIDIDISKKVCLKYAVDSMEFSQYMQQCGEMLEEIMKILHRIGLQGYSENSGFRGYHIWIFFTEWIPVRYVNALSQIIAGEIHNIQKEEISVEYFPDNRKIRAGKAGQSIKLPLGLNSKSGRIGYFLEQNFETVTDLDGYLKNIAKFSLEAVKRIIGMYAGRQEGGDLSTDRKNILDNNLEPFGKLGSEIQTVLEKCNLMCYLCQKARKTGYLTHFERLSILYVFGHMGDEGKEFVHQVMAYTLNYQYQITERFINKVPQKPISCIKLRDQYRQITAEIGCTCNFRRTKNCYPSPVLHAIKSSDTANEQITIPASRTLSKEKEKNVYQEINVYKKVQELAEKILTMKKQRRGIDKNIAKVERELENVFDGMKMDCLEIEMGLLCRRKIDDGGYEWFIEI